MECAGIIIAGDSLGNKGVAMNIIQMAGFRAKRDYPGYDRTIERNPTIAKLQWTAENVMLMVEAAYLSGRLDEHDKAVADMQMMKARQEVSGGHE